MLVKKKDGFTSAEDLCKALCDGKLLYFEPNNCIYQMKESILLVAHNNSCDHLSPTKFSLDNFKNHFTDFFIAEEVKEENTGIEVKVLLDKHLFSFTSFHDWVNHATEVYRSTGLTEKQYITIDSKGRICTCGKEMMRARDDNSFPVNVYKIL